MKFKILFVLLFLPFLLFAQQGINNNWLQGYQSSGGIPFGQSRLDFFSGNPVISYDSIKMDFNHTHANISDSLGNMLFYTNGYYIANANNDTMFNGSGLSPSMYANDYSDGFLIPQGALVLPKPGSSSIYYLFHSVDDNYPNPGNYFALKLYVTTIDMSLNGGLGGVISKNMVLISDSLNLGKITACKASNGRDWWVLVHKLNSNTFYRLLITPAAIVGPYTQSIGSYREWDVGQMKFSPNGNKLAYYHYRFTGLDVFDFNRCTGLLSNPINDTLPLEVGPVGCEFSPNSQMLYVSNVTKVYQYDLTSSNIVSSRLIVAYWDGFDQPGVPNLGVYLCQPQLAPDGKIYLTTGNGTTYFGCIEYPDSVGISCNVAQHSILLPTYYFNTLPNHPNYFLDCDTTLGCGCLTAINNVNITNSQLKSFPNPTTGSFTLQFNVQNTTGTVEIFDVNGKSFLKENIPPWSQYKHLSIGNFPKGIYYCKLKWGSREANTKVIKQ